jgi:hypothetical protein
MKSYDVDMDSFVNVLLPDDCDPNTTEGYAILLEAARDKFMERLRSRDVTFLWERYEDGDTEDGDTTEGRE